MSAPDVSSADDIKSRDRLWASVYETHYYTSIYESTSDCLFARWQGLDMLTRVLVMITASGSAVAGWSLWAQPDYRMIWVIIAAIGALFSIVHAALNVPSRLKSLSDCKRLFSSLRIDLETMRYQMEIFPKFDVVECNTQFLDLRKKYQEGVEIVPDDPLLTDRVRQRVQQELDARIESRRYEK